MGVDVQATAVATAITTTRVSVAVSLAGANRFALVHVGYTAGGTLVSASYDGTAMTKEVCAAEGAIRGALFSLTNASAGLVPIVVDFQATATTIAIGIIGFTSVQQTTPLGPIHAVASTGAANASANASAASGDIPLGFITCGDTTISGFQTDALFNQVAVDALQSHSTMGLRDSGDNTLRVFRWGDIGNANAYVALGVQVRQFQASAGAAGPFGIIGGRGTTAGELGVTDPMGSVGDEEVAGDSRDDS